MIITTKDKLEVEVDKDAFDDMEALDLMREMEEGNPTSLSKFCSLVFSKETKKTIYDFCRNEKGRVPVEKAVEIIVEIMNLMGEEGKN